MVLPQVELFGASLPNVSPTSRAGECVADRRAAEGRAVNERAAIE